MLKLLISAILLFLTIVCNAQGGWNIGYLKVDSINKNHIGKIVRIDFKSKNAWISTDGQRDIRSYVGTKDTGTIKIDTTLLILVERREMYVDHGGYSEQYLECINCKQEFVFIYDAVILSTDNQAIMFQFNIDTKRTNQPVIREARNVRIDRNELDGVMYKL